MKLLFGIALLIGVLVGRSSFAATFYVATTGDDSNSCTEAQNPSTAKRNIIGDRGGLIGSYCKVSLNALLNSAANSVKRKISLTRPARFGSSGSSAPTSRAIESICAFSNARLVSLGLVSARHGVVSFGVAIDSACGNTAR